jgi:signal transduction histidine kinase
MIALNTIRSRLIAMMLSSSLVALLSAGITIFAVEGERARTVLKDELSVVANLVGNHSTAALSFLDQSTAQESLSSLGGMPNIEAACLLNDNGAVFVSYHRPETQPWNCIESAIDESDGLGTAVISNTLVVAMPIVSKGSNIGTIMLKSSFEPLQARTRALLFSLLFAALAALVITIPIALNLQRPISKPLYRIRQSTEEIIETQDYSLRVPTSEISEISKMATAFNTMLTTIEHQKAALLNTANDLEIQVAARTAELSASKQTLEQTLAALQAAQHDMIQQEKLASLGSLVAGVAHELNTPMGNAIVVCSSLESEINGLNDDVNSGALRKSVLIGRIEKLRLGTDIALRNLHRAASLVTSFKQVAVDQTSERRRKFDLAIAVREIIGTLSPMLKHKISGIHVDIDEDIKLDSYPGPLGQIITNLVMNAQIHGYDGDPSGVIEIHGKAAGEHFAIIEIKDFGRGIAPENIDRIFDPFFTTRLGQGGSGLGLNIVYNMVTSTLGGSIRVSSTQGEGTCFILKLPREAPHKESAEKC